MRRDLPPLGLLALCLASLVTLAACEKGKPRHVPPDPMAVTPPPPGPAAPPTQGASAGLPARPEAPVFTIDRIGDALDPLNRRPAVTAAGRPTVISGFGLDAVAKAPGKALDVVVDGRAYGAAYGAERPDVAAYFKSAAMAKVGFSTTLPAGALAVGQHTAFVRVVAADGKGYFDGAKIHFQVR